MGGFKEWVDGCMGTFWVRAGERKSREEIIGNVKRDLPIIIIIKYQILPSLLNNKFWVDFPSERFAIFCADDAALFLKNITEIWRDFPSGPFAVFCIEGDAALSLRGGEGVREWVSTEGGRGCILSGEWHAKKNIQLTEKGKKDHIYIYTYIYVYMYKYVYTHTHIHIYVYMYKYMCTHIHTYIYTDIHIYIQTDIHTRTHTHIGPRAGGISRMVVQDQLLH